MEKESLELICSEVGEIGKRLDMFLTEKFPGYSRSYFKNLISEGLITLNDTIIDRPGYSLKHGDRIFLANLPPRLNLEPSPVDFDIVDQTDDFLVINKPAGLLVHHSLSTSPEPSLVNGLLYRFPEFSQFSDQARAGIVHRLDKNTSGLLLIARNIVSQEKLMALFKQRLIHKTYMAVVVGHPPQEGSINLPVGRDLQHPYKMATKGLYCKPALTHYQVLKYFEEENQKHALVSVQLITGRTHQIRVHFAAIGHPLEGDEVYGKASPCIDRQALHAAKINFILYTGSSPWYFAGTAYSLLIISS